MLREECKTGMKVVFGRPNGEKTVGEIVEVHETKAQIKTLESRGDGNRGSEEHRTKKRPAGTVWSISFGIMEPLNRTLLEALHSLPPKEENLLDYLERGSKTLIGESTCRRARACMFEDEELAILRTIILNHRSRRSIAERIKGFQRDLSASADKPGSCGKCDFCINLREKREDIQFEVKSLTTHLERHNHRLRLLFEILGRPVSEAVYRAWEDDRRINKEIDKEFADIWDRVKARRHWRKVCEIFLNDYDYQERINLWNERRLSPAWIEAGLNKNGQDPSPTAPAKWPVPHFSKLPTLKHRREAWRAEKEAAQAHQPAQTP
jgi:hypothetical protein